MLEKAIRYICRTAEIPSFSSYEERLHPYIEHFFSELPDTGQISVPGNNLVYQIGNRSSERTIALAAHLDKINHYGEEFPDKLPVHVSDTYIEGAMDDSAGLGIVLAMAEYYAKAEKKPNILFFFSEMEESKGLKEHPELLKKSGEGYSHGMGARRISHACLDKNIIPDEIITIDTTPLFKGKTGIALYSKHWELNSLGSIKELMELTSKSVQRFKNIDPNILLENNTNDFLTYGYEFNKNGPQAIVSVALEPAIYPYHQKGERVFISDIDQVLYILTAYINGLC